MQLEAAEDHVKVPGLSLEEATALVRLRLERRFWSSYEDYAPILRELARREMGKA